MLTRKTDEIPDMDMYVCGFPCTPFSILRRHKSRLLREAAAKPFFKILEVLRERKPALAVLENVIGIAKVKKKVLAMLVKLGCYIIIVVQIDSKALGVAVSRPRYYFILLRVDRAITQKDDDLEALGKGIMAACGKPVEGTVVDLLLPSSLAAESATKVRARKLGSSGSAGREVSSSKWVTKHANFRQKLGLPARTTPLGSDYMGLTTDRERDAWQILLEAHPGQDIIADMSQNVDRSRVVTNGVCPTITPNSIMCLKAAKRRVYPMETLPLHYFPIHRMRIPRTVKPKTLANLGGNTMHLKSVGLAMCMGLAMIKAPTSPTSDDIGALGMLGRTIFLDGARSSSKRAASKRKSSSKLAASKRTRKQPTTKRRNMSNSI